MFNSLMPNKKCRNRNGSECTAIVYENCAAASLFRRTQMNLSRMVRHEGLDPRPKSRNCGRTMRDRFRIQRTEPLHTGYDHFNACRVSELQYSRGLPCRQDFRHPTGSSITSSAVAAVACRAAAEPDQTAFASPRRSSICTLLPGLRSNLPSLANHDGLPRQARKHFHAPGSGLPCR